MKTLEERIIERMKVQMERLRLDGRAMEICAAIIRDEFARVKPVEGGLAERITAEFERCSNGAQSHHAPLCIEVGALESQRDQLAAEVERLKKVAKQATQGMFIHGVTGKYTIHRDGHDIRVDNAFELGNYLTTKGCSKGENS